MLGLDENPFPKPLIEAPRDLAHELDVLALVVADGDLVGAIREHIGGLEHRIEEQCRRDELALFCGLVLELGHPVEVPVGGDRREEPAELGVLVDVGLPKEDAALGIEAGCEEDRSRVVEALPESLGSYATEIACRSTRQKIPSPRSWLSTYCEIAPM